MLSLLLFSFYVFGQERFKNLSQIDDMIASQEYSAALKALSEYIKEKPDDFDSAQKRVRKIINARNFYNLQASKLVEKMADENSSDDEKMEIILDMEKSEKNRGAEAVALTNDARRNVALQYYINRSNRIMRESTNLVSQGTADSGKYSQAIELSKECLPPTLKTSDSDVVYYEGEEIPVTYSRGLVKKVEESVQRINSYNYAKAISECELAYDSFLTSVKNGDAALSREKFVRVNETFRNLSVIINKIYQEGEVLAQLDQQAIQEQVQIQRDRGLEPTVPDTTYITFGKWGVVGVGDDSARGIQGADSGIIGNLNAYWNTRVESMKKEVAQQVGGGFAAIAQLLPEEDLFTLDDTSSITSERNKISVFAETGKNVQKLYGLVPNNMASKFTKYDASMDFVQKLNSGYRSAVSRIRDISEENKKISALSKENVDLYEKNVLTSLTFYNSKEKDSVSALSEDYLKNEKQQMEKLSAEKETDATNDAELTEQTRMTAGLVLVDESVVWNDAIAKYEKIVTDSQNECRNRQYTIWTEIAKRYSDEADDRFVKFMNQFAQAKKTSGIENTDITESFYPSKSIVEFQNLNKNISSTKTRLNSFLTTLDGGVAYRESDSLFERSYLNIQNVIKNLDGIVVDSNRLIAICQDRVMRAQRAANAAENFYNLANRDVENAIKYQDNDLFNAARQKMDQARENYSNSLAFENNETLKADSDRKLSQLEEKINVNQQRIIVAQTRKLKTSARDAYFSGNFVEAEQNLSLAKNLWAITNGEDLDRETEDLLNMVKRAMEMKTGLTIPITHPYYPEMSQILNMANQYYSEGSALNKKGKKAEAEEILKTAKQKLEMVKSHFPLNKDARVLTLKIDRLIDPQKFEKDFAQNVRIAREQASGVAKKSNRQKSEVEEAYAELEVLREMNPKFSGLADFIEKFEYDVGIKTRPVKQTDDSAKRSRTLYTQALSIYNSAKGNQEELAKAVARLDDAIALDHNNSKATALKDKIATEIGGTASSILKDEDERAYRQILELVRQEDYSIALVRTQQLMQKGNNSKNKKLQELRSRILSLSGISL